MEHRTHTHPAPESAELLYRCVLSLKTEEDCARFFEDLCSVSELQAMVQRLQVAMALREGKTYQEIVNVIGASTVTISRVNRCLQYGADGYALALAALEEEKGS